MERIEWIILPLWGGWVLDTLLGDPRWLPHPVVGFGRWISAGEKALNRGKARIFKGAIFTAGSVLFLFTASFLLFHYLEKQYPASGIAWATVLVFYCLAGKTLTREVRAVFRAVGRSTEEGRKQLARIVGRDTSALNDRQIRTAALETLAENLSDGVIAPLFWYTVLGIPGMLTYKLINTFDSMIGYKNERYLHFGRWAARMDDAANYFPARITALLMLVAGAGLGRLSFVRRYGTAHTSPNAGFPEAALAALLDGRFGGPNHYDGQQMEKPYIGDTPRDFDDQDLKKSILINERTEVMALIMSTVTLLTVNYLTIN